MTLSSLGWNEFFANHFSSLSSAMPLLPARVTHEHKHAYVLLTAHGEVRAECTGRFLHAATARSELPAVGDWVAITSRPDELRADIHAVLPRRTKFSRQASGDAPEEQVIAANVDTVLLVTALDSNFNLRRIERYLAVARASGAEPVILLNKADLHPDPAAAAMGVAAIAAGAPVVALSAESAIPLAAQDGNAVPSWRYPVPILLARWLIPGRTIALLGSSGVGKSTLTNCLLGLEQQATGGVSEGHGKGRHTTTQRTLLVAPSGALVMDTPGLRELQLWDVPDEALEETFSDIAAFSARCRFSDCAHDREPGCAVRSALETGALEAQRWRSFQKLQREQAYAARQSDERLARETKGKWKKLSYAQRLHARRKGGD